MRSKGLGKGLRALIPTVPEGIGVGGEILELPLEKIQPSPHQARRSFDEGALEELAASIKEHGVLQPVVVRPLGDGSYELVVGERRWRACQRAGLKTIPALVKTVDDRTSSEMMLVENLQREDLSPLEAAHAYKRLIEEFGLTQEEVAERVGKSRAFIANMMRLLQLPPEVQALLAQGALSVGHCKAILSLPTPQQQVSLAREVVRRNLSVRETENVAKKTTSPARVPRRGTGAGQANHFAERLQQLLGTKVRVKQWRRGGKIEILFYSREELERLLEWFLSHLEASSSPR